VVHLLRGDVVDCGAGGHGGDARRGARRVAADVAGGGVLDAVFALGVFGLPGDGPVFGLGDAVDHEAGECVWGC